MAERPQILRDFDRAVAHRQEAEPVLRAAYELALPWHLGGWTNSRLGLKAPAAHVMDGHPMRALQEDATRLAGELVLNFDTWFKLELGPSGQDLSAEDRDKAKAGLGEIQDIIHHFIRASDTLSQILPALQEERISTGVIIVHELKEPPYIQVESLPLSQCWLLAGPRGNVSHIFRKWSVKRGEVTQLWSDAKIPYDGAGKRDDQEITLIECQSPLTEKPGWVKIEVVTEKGEPIRKAQEMRSAPMIAFRSAVLPGTPFGVGPMLTALPDMKVLNKVAEFTLRGAALAVAPPLQAEDDGILDPSDFTWQPNQLHLVERGSQGIRPIQAAGNIDLGYFVADQLRGAVDRTIEPPLPPMGGERKTEAEILTHRARQEAVRVPRLQRLFAELIVPFVRRTAEILVRRNVLQADMLGEAYPFDGTVATVVPSSPLDRQFREIQLQQQMQAIQAAAALDPMEMAARVDIPGSVHRLLEHSNFPPELIRRGKAYEDEKERLMEARAKAEQAAMAAENGGAS